MLHAIGEREPQVGEGAFVAWNAEVAGDIRLGAGSSVWFSATLRADIAAIELGEGSNVQDGAVVHVDRDGPCRIGAGVTVGHGAILHACEIGDGSLIGMGAIVLSGAKIGQESMVAAGSLVTQGKAFPPRSLVMGSPAKLARELGEEEVVKMRENAREYQALAAKAVTEYRELP
jgi:carbonic anhydrase/acetyltransferase-like protein (isoleucine patch superfamily)